MKGPMFDTGHRYPSRDTAIRFRILCAGTGAAVAGALLLPGLVTSAGAATPPAGQRFGGAVGSVAAITGTSMEVQNPATGQTTVDWSSSTTFTLTTTVASSAVTVGECVTVSGTPSKDKITARTVAISPLPSSGTCPGAGTGGFAGPGGLPGAGGRAFTRPTGSPPPTFVHSGTSPNGTHRTFPGTARFGFATGSTAANGAVSAATVRITSSGGGSCTSGFQVGGGFQVGVTGA